MSGMILRFLTLVALFAIAGCGRAGKTSVAVLQLEQGRLEFELLAGDAPKAVENFRLLAERGFYNGLTFHRVVKDFMIQGGDPKGDGTGGESAWGGTFDDECQPRSLLYQGGLGYKRGIVAMANRGPNTNSSQFFIIHQDHPLPPSYTIFGRVTKGLEVLDAIATVPTLPGADGANSRPAKPVIIQKATIRR
ncbi:MAG: hypothetical protein RLZZ15_3175 [Verrucomicrobiota bacterium]|jgi:cyclophilin family peptidyl-prolyl cis-trans isomerase